MSTGKGPHPADIHIGRRIRLRRLMIGMSQERLGERLGLTFQQVQKYEKGANRVGGSRLCAISRVLNVPPGYFFEGLDDRGGTAPSDAADDALSFLATGEGLRLVAAFQRIANRETRLKLIDLIGSIADDPDHDP